MPKIVNLPVLSRQFAEPLLEKPAFRLLAGEPNGPLVGVLGVKDSSETPAKLGPSGVRQVIIRKVAAGDDGVDQLQAGQGAVAHGHGHCPVQLDHR